MIAPYRKQSVPQGDSPTGYFRGETPGQHVFLRLGKRLWHLGFPPPKTPRDQALCHRCDIVCAKTSLTRRFTHFADKTRGQRRFELRSATFGEGQQILSGVGETRGHRLFARLSRERRCGSRDGVLVATMSQRFPAATGRAAPVRAGLQSPLGTWGLGVVLKGRVTPRVWGGLGMAAWHLLFAVVPCWSASAVFGGRSCSERDAGQPLLDRPASRSRSLRTDLVSPGPPPPRGSRWKGCGVTARADPVSQRVRSRLRCGHAAPPLAPGAGRLGRCRGRGLFTSGPEAYGAGVVSWCRKPACSSGFGWPAR